MLDVLGGQQWPQMDETEMKNLSDQWTQAHSALAAMGDDVTAAMHNVLRGYSGSGSDQFQQFMTQLAAAPGQMAPALKQVGSSASSAALNTETTKLMMLAQVAWTLAEVADLTSTLWGWVAVPEVLAGSRLVIARLARALAKAALHGAVQQGGMNLGVQLFELLVGDRDSIDWNEVVSSIELGAFTGALAGAVHLGAEKLAPNFVKSLAGHVALGAVDGLGVGEATALTFGGGQDPALLLGSGLIGAAGGALKSRHDGDGAPDIPAVRLPDDTFSDDELSDFTSSDDTSSGDTFSDTTFSDDESSDGDQQDDEFPGHNGFSGDAFDGSSDRTLASDDGSSDRTSVDPDHILRMGSLSGAAPLHTPETSLSQADSQPENAAETTAQQPAPLERGISQTAAETRAGTTGTEGSPLASPHQQVASPHQQDGSDATAVNTRQDTAAAGSQAPHPQPAEEALAVQHASPTQHDPAATVAGQAGDQTLPEDQAVPGQSSVAGAHEPRAQDNGGQQPAGPLASQPRAGSPEPQAGGEEPQAVTQSGRLPAIQADGPGEAPPNQPEPEGNSPTLDVFEHDTPELSTGQPTQDTDTAVAVTEVEPTPARAADPSLPGTAHTTEDTDDPQDPGTPSGTVRFPAPEPGPDRGRGAAGMSPAVFPARVPDASDIMRGMLGQQKASALRDGGLPALFRTQRHPGKLSSVAASPDTPARHDNGGGNRAGQPPKDAPSAPSAGVRNEPSHGDPGTKQDDVVPPAAPPAGAPHGGDRLADVTPGSGHDVAPSRHETTEEAAGEVGGGVVGSGAHLLARRAPEKDQLVPPVSGNGKPHGIPPSQAASRAGESAHPRSVPEPGHPAPSRDAEGAVAGSRTLAESELDLGGGRMVKLPDGTRAEFSDGELWHVTLPDDTVYHRTLDGGWSAPRARSGDMQAIKTSDPITVKLRDGGEITFSARSDLVTDRNVAAHGDESLDGSKRTADLRSGDGDGPSDLDEVAERGMNLTAIRGTGDDGQVHTVVYGKGGWTETHVDETRYQATLAAAERRTDVVRDFLRLSERKESLAGLGTEDLKSLLQRPGSSDDDRFSAIYEILRRGRNTEGLAPIRGKSARWVQVAAARELDEGNNVNMDAGEGKTLVFQMAAVTKALKSRDDGVGVKFVTSRDYLADEAHKAFSLFEQYGVKIVRIKQDVKTPLPVKGEATVYVTTMRDDAFNILEYPGHQAPAHVFIDEQDEAMFYVNQAFIKSVGPDTPVGPEIKGQLEWDDHFVQGKLNNLDYEHDKGNFRLNDSGLAKLKQELNVNGKPPANRVAGVEQAIRAHHGLREGTHYVVNRHEDRINLIEQVTNKVSVDDGQGVGATRFRGGLHQRLEVKHGTMVREDGPEGTDKELSQRDYFNHPSIKSVTGASGTNMGKQGHYDALRPGDGPSGDVYKAPRYYTERSTEIDALLTSSRADKFDKIADIVIERSRERKATLALPADNRDVGGIADALTSKGFTSFTRADADWYVTKNWEFKQATAAGLKGKTADEALGDVIDNVGKPGSVTLSSMINRGADPAIDDEVSKLGGLGVVTDHSKLSRDIDVQAIKRGGRNGDKSTYQFVDSVDDEIFTSSHNPNLPIAIYQYKKAFSATHFDAGVRPGGETAHRGLGGHTSVTADDGASTDRGVTSDDGMSVHGSETSHDSAWTDDQTSSASVSSHDSLASDGATPASGMDSPHEAGSFDQNPVGSDAGAQLRQAGQRLLDLVPTLQAEAFHQRVTDGVLSLKDKTFGQLRAGLSQATAPAGPARATVRTEHHSHPAAPRLTVGDHSFDALSPRANGDAVSFKFGQPAPVASGPRAGGGFFTAMHESARFQGFAPVLGAKGISSARELRQATLDAFAAEPVAPGQSRDGPLHGLDPESLDYWMEEGARRATELAHIARDEGFAEAIATVIHEARFDGTRLGSLLPMITARVLDLPVTMVVSSTAGTAATVLGREGGRQIFVGYDSDQRSWRTLVPAEMDPTLAHESSRVSDVAEGDRSDAATTDDPSRAVRIPGADHAALAAADSSVPLASGHGAVVTSPLVRAWVSEHVPSVMGWFTLAGAFDPAAGGVLAGADGLVLSPTDLAAVLPRLPGWREALADSGAGVPQVILLACGAAAAAAAASYAARLAEEIGGTTLSTVADVVIAPGTSEVTLAGEAPLDAASGWQVHQAGRPGRLYQGQGLLDVLRQVAADQASVPGVPALVVTPAERTHDGAHFGNIPSRAKRTFRARRPQARPGQGERRVGAEDLVDGWMPSGSQSKTKATEFGSITSALRGAVPSLRDTLTRQGEVGAVDQLVGLVESHRLIPPVQWLARAVDVELARHGAWNMVPVATRDVRMALNAVVAQRRIDPYRAPLSGLTAKVAWELAGDLRDPEPDDPDTVEARGRALVRARASYLESAARQRHLPPGEGSGYDQFVGQLQSDRRAHEELAARWSAVVAGRVNRELDTWVRADGRQALRALARKLDLVRGSVRQAFEVLAVGPGQTRLQVQQAFGTLANALGVAWEAQQAFSVLAAGLNLVEDPLLEPEDQERPFLEQEDIWQAFEALAGEPVLRSGDVRGAFGALADRLNLARRDVREAFRTLADELNPARETALQTFLDLANRGGLDAVDGGDAFRALADGPVLALPAVDLADIGSLTNMITEMMVVQARTSPEMEMARELTSDWYPFRHEVFQESWTFLAAVAHVRRAWLAGGRPAAVDLAMRVSEAGMRIPPAWLLADMVALHSDQLGLSGDDRVQASEWHVRQIYASLTQQGRVPLPPADPDGRPADWERVARAIAATRGAQLPSAGRPQAATNPELANLVRSAMARARRGPVVNDAAINRAHEIVLHRLRYVPVTMAELRDRIVQVLLSGDVFKQLGGAPQQAASANRDGVSWTGQASGSRSRTAGADNNREPSHETVTAGVGPVADGARELTRQQERERAGQRSVAIAAAFPWLGSVPAALGRRGLAIGAEGYLTEFGAQLSAAAVFRALLNPPEAADEQWDPWAGEHQAPWEVLTDGHRDQVRWQLARTLAEVRTEVALLPPGTLGLVRWEREPSVDRAAEHQWLVAVKHSDPRIGALLLDGGTGSEATDPDGERAIWFTAIPGATLAHDAPLSRPREPAPLATSSDPVAGEGDVDAYPVSASGTADRSPQDLIREAAQVGNTVSPSEAADLTARLGSGDDEQDIVHAGLWSDGTADDSSVGTESAKERGSRRSGQSRRAAQAVASGGARAGDQGMPTVAGSGEEDWNSQDDRAASHGGVPSPLRQQDTEDSAPAVLGVTGVVSVARGVGELEERIAPALVSFGAPSGEPGLLECLMRLESVRGVLFPRGVYPSGTVDDSVVGSDMRSRPEDRLAPGSDWRRVADWGRVADALARAEPGSVAFVLARRLGTGPDVTGHAWAAYRLRPDGATGESTGARTAENRDVAWIEVLNGEGRRVSFAPPASVLPVEAKAVIVDPSGRTDQTALPFLASSDIPGAALTDPAASHTYGAIGLEVEDRRMLVWPGGSMPPAGTLLAEHPSGMKIVVDLRQMYDGPDGTVHLFHRPGQNPNEFIPARVAEIISPPLQVFDTDAGRMPVSEGLDRVEQIFASMAVADNAPGPRRGRPLRATPLRNLLGSDANWAFTPPGLTAQVTSRPVDWHIYPQVTAGIPIRDAGGLIALVFRSLRRFPWMFDLLDVGRDFALQVARRYAEKKFSVKDNTWSWHLLSVLPGVDEIYGYTWLAFNDVGGGVMYQIFKMELLSKNNTPMALRNTWDHIHGTLHQSIRDFLAENEQWITEAFSAALGGLGRRQGGFPVGYSGDILAQRFESGITFGDWVTATITGYRRIRERNGGTTPVPLSLQDTFRMTEYPLDTYGGRTGDPLILIELREFITEIHLGGPQSLRAPVDFLVKALQRGNARAGFPREFTVSHREVAELESDSLFLSVNKALKLSEPLKESGTIAGTPVQHPLVKEVAHELRGLLELLLGRNDRISGQVGNALLALAEAIKAERVKLKLSPGSPRYAEFKEAGAHAMAAAYRVGAVRLLRENGTSFIPSLQEFDEAEKAFPGPPDLTQYTQLLWARHELNRDSQDYPNSEILIGLARLPGLKLFDRRAPEAESSTAPSTYEELKGFLSSRRAWASQAGPGPGAASRTRTPQALAGRRRGGSLGASRAEPHSSHHGPYASSSRHGPYASATAVDGPVRSGAGFDTSGPEWARARRLAGPVERTHTWAHPFAFPGNGEEVPVHATARERLEDARDGEPGNPESRSDLHSAFAVRRFMHEGQAVTDLTVRVAMHPSPDVTPDDVTAARAAALAGAEHLSAEGVVPRLKSGDRLHVTVLFTDSDTPLARHDQGGPHLTVELVNDDSGMTQTRWQASAGALRYAHEIAHQIGLRDNHGIHGALMGEFGHELPREWETAGLTQDGLRQRDIELLHHLIGDNLPLHDHITPAVRLRGGAGEPDILAGWRRLSQLGKPRRSPALRRIDRAVAAAALRRGESEPQRQILTAIDSWRGGKDAVSIRDGVVDELQRHVRGELGIPEPVITGVAPMPVAQEPLPRSAGFDVEVQRDAALRVPEEGPATQRMVVSGRDLLIAEALKSGQPGDRAEMMRSELANVRAAIRDLPPGADDGPWRHQAWRIGEDLQILKDMAERPDAAWPRLRESQVAALVLAERRGRQAAAAARATARARLDAWQWTAQYAGMDLDQLLDRVHDHLRTGMQLTTNMTAGRLDQLIADPDGRFHNSWEHRLDSTEPGVPAGPYTDDRALSEHKLGYAANVRIADRVYPAYDSREARDLPKYAALTSRSQPEGWTSYGSNVLIWRPEVRARATFTPSDSLVGEEAPAERVTGPDHLYPLLAYAKEDMVRLAFAEATGFAHDPGIQASRRNRGFGFLDYAEAQIHGDLTWADVEHVILWHDEATLPAQQDARDRILAMAREHSLGLTVELRAKQPRTTRRAPRTPAPATAGGPQAGPHPASGGHGTDAGMPGQTATIPSSHPGWTRQQDPGTPSDAARGRGAAGMSPAVFPARGPDAHDIMRGMLGQQKASALRDGDLPALFRTQRSPDQLSPVASPDTRARHDNGRTAQPREEPPPPHQWDDVLRLRGGSARFDSLRELTRRLTRQSQHAPASHDTDHAAAVPHVARRPGPSRPSGRPKSREGQVRELVDERRVRDRRDGLEPVAGPDVFGVRRPPAPPEFLAGYRYEDLHAAHRAAFFRELDMTRDATPERASLAPGTLARGPVSEGPLGQARNGFPKRLKVAHVQHSIWLGGILPEQERMNLQQARQHNHGFESVLWTDATRQEISAARNADPATLTGRPAQVRTLLDWARDAQVRLVNVDEVFNAGHPPLLAGQIGTERGKAYPGSWAVASDMLRVEILSEFGGVYTDPDNTLHPGGLAKAAAAAARAPGGIAIGRQLRTITEPLPSRPSTNGLLASAARSDGIMHYRQELRERYAAPYADLMTQGSRGGRPGTAARNDLNQAGDTLRAEVQRRTGPNTHTFDALARRLRIGTADAPRDALAPIPEDVATLGQAHAWLPGTNTRVAAPPADPAEVAAAVVGAVVSLHHEMGNRDGGLWLPAAARVITRLPGPDRDHAWQTALDYLHDTLPAHTTIAWISAADIDLPEPVRQHISQLFPHTPQVRFPAPEPWPDRGPDAAGMSPAVFPARVPDAHDIMREMLGQQKASALRDGDLPALFRTQRHLDKLSSVAASPDTPARHDNGGENRAGQPPKDAPSRKAPTAVERASTLVKRWMPLAFEGDDEFRELVSILLETISERGDEAAIAQMTEMAEARELIPPASWLVGAVNVELARRGRWDQVMRGEAEVRQALGAAMEAELIDPLQMSLSELAREIAGTLPDSSPGTAAEGGTTREARDSALARAADRLPPADDGLSPTRAQQLADRVNSLLLEAPGHSGAAPIAQEDVRQAFRALVRGPLLALPSVDVTDEEGLAHIILQMLLVETDRAMADDRRLVRRWWPFRLEAEAEPWTFRAAVVRVVEKRRSHGHEAALELAVRISEAGLRILPGRVLAGLVQRTVAEDYDLTAEDLAADPNHPVARPAEEGKVRLDYAWLVQGQRVQLPAVGRATSFDWERIATMIALLPWRSQDVTRVQEWQDPPQAPLDTDRTILKLVKSAMQRVEPDRDLRDEEINDAHQYVLDALGDEPNTLEELRDHIMHALLLEGSAGGADAGSGQEPRSRWSESEGSAGTVARHDSESVAEEDASATAAEVAAKDGNTLESPEHAASRERQPLDPDFLQQLEELPPRPTSEDAPRPTARVRDWDALSAIRGTSRSAAPKKSADSHADVAVRGPLDQLDSDPAMTPEGYTDHFGFRPQAIARTIDREGIRRLTPEGESQHENSVRPAEHLGSQQEHDTAARQPSGRDQPGEIRTGGHPRTQEPQTLTQAVSNEPDQAPVSTEPHHESLSPSDLTTGTASNSPAVRRGTEARANLIADLLAGNGRPKMAGRTLKGNWPDWSRRLASSAQANARTPEDLLTEALADVSDGQDCAVRLELAALLWYPHQGAPIDDSMLSSKPEARLASRLGQPWRSAAGDLAAVKRRVEELGPGATAFVLTSPPDRLGPGGPDNARHAYALRNENGEVSLVETQADPGYRFQPIEPWLSPVPPVDVRVIVADRNGRAVPDPFGSTALPSGGHDGLFDPAVSRAYGAGRGPAENYAEEPDLAAMREEYERYLENPFNIPFNNHGPGQTQDSTDVDGPLDDPSADGSVLWLQHLFDAPPQDLRPSALDRAQQPERYTTPGPRANTGRADDLATTSSTHEAGGPSHQREPGTSSSARYRTRLKKALESDNKEAREEAQRKLDTERNRHRERTKKRRARIAASLGSEDQETRERAQEQRDRTNLYEKNRKADARSALKNSLKSDDPTVREQAQAEYEARKKYYRDKQAEHRARKKKALEQDLTSHENEGSSTIDPEP